MRSTAKRFDWGWKARLSGLPGWLLVAANRDFCPCAERYVGWLRQPLGWLVIAAAASLLLGLTLGSQGLVMFAVIAAFVAMGVLWPWVTMRGITSEVRFRRRRAQEDEPVEVELWVTNRWPWPAVGLTLERGFHEECLGGPAVALASVPGWSKSMFTFRFTPERRGRYPVEPPQVCCGFPFGLWSSGCKVHVERKLVVHPRLVRLSSLPATSGSRLAVAAIQSERPGDEGDVIGVRPYRRGDSLRRIHWVQTARHDQLITCERQATARREVCVWIDADPAAHRGTGKNGSWEWCLRIGASICRQFHAHHASVRCVIGPHRLDLLPGAGGSTSSWTSWRKWRTRMISRREQSAEPIKLTAGKRAVCRSGTVSFLRWSPRTTTSTL